MSTRAVGGSGEVYGQAQNSLYNSVTESRPWRWTIGRVSCGLRIPVYLLAAVFQTIKMIAKFAVSCLTFNQLRRFECTSSWTFQGLAKDGIANLSLLQHTTNSIWCVIWAPPKKYHSFAGAFKVCGNALWGSYHNITSLNHRDEKMKVGELWFAFRLKVPNYLKQIIQSDCLLNGTAKQ